MAMNFFEHQAQARRHTGRLVILFVCGVCALIASTYFIGLLIAMVVSKGELGGEPLMHAGLFAASVAVSLLIVGLGWLVKRVQLASGGRAVAESLGGRLIHPATGDPRERRVINIVEEMAIASGVPVPPVYVMPDRSINAFAAGYRPEQAVIGVTEGALSAFTRDELQGVIAHEFSHILNGDMRLNIRLIAVIAGLGGLALVGGTLIRVLGHTGGTRRSSSKGGGGAAILILLIAGVGLLIIGWVGGLFGRLMQAAVSRQREFLADASAVQFTRNPAGIAGALRRIARFGTNNMERANAAEYSHLFFTNALESYFATHPPLAERIARIEHRPDAEVERDLVRGEARPDAAQGSSEEGIDAATMAFGGPEAGAPARERLASTRAPLPAPLLRAMESSTRSRAGVAHAAAASGQVEPEAIDYARAIMTRLPTGILAAAHEPYDARGVIAALLLSDDASTRAKQLDALARAGLHDLSELAQRLGEGIPRLSRDLKLPLVDLCVPALRRLSHAQAAAMLEAVRTLIAADERLDLYEWALRAVLRRAFEPWSEPAGGGVRLAMLLPQMAQLMATLAWAGARDSARANAAFMAGYIAAGVPAPPLQPRGECTLDRLDDAVKKLARLRALDRDRVATAAVECVSSDEVVTVSEAEILRATISLLGAPMPPVLPTTTEE